MPLDSIDNISKKTILYNVEIVVNEDGTSEEVYEIAIEILKNKSDPLIYLYSLEYEISCEKIVVLE
jgi:hypothetical protein